MDATAPQAFDIRVMNASASFLFVLAAFAFAGLLLMWLARLPLFSIRSIQIDGDVSRNSVTTIRANAAPKLAGNFFTMDLALSQQAFEAVPWVRRALVKRVWPNRLAVRLEEHKAAAYWHREDRDDQLVNTFGEVFDVNLGDVEDDTLPTLQGPEGHAADMLDMHRRLTPVLARLDGAAIEELKLSERGSWRAELDTGAEIELGRGTADEVVARCETFVETVTQVIARYQRPLEYADLRHGTGYAVRLKGITTVDLQTKKTTK
jgi:cell division protein FtsQ